MTSARTAVYGVAATLLVAWLAAANMPAPVASPRPRPPRAAGSRGPDALALEVRSQADRLRARMAQAPVPDANPRNPFSFAAPIRTARATPGRDFLVRAATVDEAPAPPLPALTLMGIAEETAAAGPRRTAVIGGEGDTIYMVAEGQPVGSRYKVTKIGADAVELEDLLTHGYRRIAMR
jgi:Tfp pilus assembly protein PilP